MKPDAARMRELGHRGGVATKARQGAEYFKQIGAMGGRARKGSKNPRRRWRICEHCGVVECLAWPKEPAICLTCIERVEQQQADSALLESLDKIIARMEEDA